MGLRLNRMMADMMYRLDEARLKLQPFEVGYLMTTPRQVNNVHDNTINPCVNV